MEKEVKAKDPTYVPAIDIGGLEEIPPLKKWWDLPGHWGKESKFRGFGPSERVTAGALIEVYLRVAVVETLVLKHTGELQTSKSPSALRRALAIDIRVESGKLWLEGDIDSLSRKPNQEDDRPSGEDMATSPPPKKVSLEEAMQLTKTWGQAWKNIILDEQFKFAVSPLPTTNPLVHGNHANGILDRCENVSTSSRAYTSPTQGSAPPPLSRTCLSLPSKTRNRPSLPRPSTGKGICSDCATSRCTVGVSGQLIRKRILAAGR